MTSPVTDTCIVNKIRIKPACKSDFVDWQASLNAMIAAFPGFVSLEISSPTAGKDFAWMVVQRFYSVDAIAKWRASIAWQQLLAELQPLLAAEPEAFSEMGAAALDKQGAVTEVIVTQVSPDKEGIYREWIAKIHQAEARFPGFRGVYVQSPSKGQGQNWITLLQFDTPENLDGWLLSKERAAMLDESKSLISSLESHRVISPYAGWFASITKGGQAPPVWKQTMIVLLVLFPIVMLELKFLSPWLSGFNSSLATFIGNALSVALVSWPMMPLAIFFLGWWLSPQVADGGKTTLIGIVVVAALYLLEIALLWHLLH